jgi:hypothetical protein
MSSSGKRLERRKLLGPERGRRRQWPILSNAVASNSAEE